MSRPRKPFGANHPGRLPATMMKVLAAEMSDPSRLRRGKQYAKDGSVLDIIVEPGTVTCEVQGSRSTPYIATVAVRPGDGMPLRRDITTTCTCPDDDNWDGHACKHVVAAMFALSDELLLEPDLLDLWRDRGAATAGGDGERTDDDDLDDGDGPERADDDDDHDDDHRDDHGGDHGDGDDAAGADDRDDRARRPRHLRLVRPGDTADGPERSAGGAAVDRLAPLLRSPTPTGLPELPELERLDHATPRDRELAAALRDALGNLHIEWG